MCEVCSKLTIKTLNIFTTYSSVSIPDFKQVNTSWLFQESALQIKLKLFFHLLKSDANFEPVTHLRREIL